MNGTDAAVNQFGSPAQLFAPSVLQAALCDRGSGLLLALQIGWKDRISRNE
jgi:hypothetical protein